MQEEKDEWAGGFTGEYEEVVEQPLEETEVAEPVELDEPVEEVEEAVEEAEPVEEVIGEVEAEGAEEVEEEDIFASYYKDKEEDQPKEVDSFDFTSLSKEIGLDVADKESFVREIQRLRSLEDSQVHFVNDDVKKHFEEISEIAKAGGDFKAIVQAESQISAKESELAEVDKDLEILNKLLETPDVRYKKEYLEALYKNDDKLSPDEKNEMIELLSQKSDAQIKYEANQHLRIQKERDGRTREKLESSLASAKAEIDREKNQIIENQKQAIATINNAIENYSDPDSKVFTPRAKVVLKKAFGTEMGQYHLPKGVAEQLFLNSDGKMDYEKIFKAINAMNFGDEKKSVIRDMGEKGLFRRMTSAKAKGSRSSGKPKADADEWSGGFVVQNDF